ncbi:MAG: hypothetical protein QG603_198 [Patescibacteria group bacterium]|nr:hypothetical protein [Patescibacteria group bacterium]MDQ5970421.1 hypothetical protein [Patescibacteria group bacterium]
MKKLLVALMLLAPAMLPARTLAQNVQEDFGTDVLEGIATSGGGTRDLYQMLAGIINTALYFLGGIAVLLFLYGGFKWFTSQGNSDQIDSAKKIMGSAVVGLAIIFASYAAAQFVINSLYNNTLGEQ